MDFPSLQAHLITEAAAFQAACAAAGPDAPVPSCPEWTAADLLDHVTETYDHKIQSMRLLRSPEDADMPEREGAPVERFAAALGELLAEFDERGPESLSYTWYGPDQTVGFWVRRMAHETVVHRADAELAAKRAIGPVDAALALDGVREMLDVMVDWGSRAYRRHLTATLEANAGLTVGLSLQKPGDTGSNPAETSWTVRVGASGVAVTAGVDPEAQAIVSGSAGDLLLWLWRRLDADALAIEGDRDRAAALHALLGEFAQ